MFKPYKNGSSVVLEGVTCYIPEPGMGSHCETGEIKATDIIKRSENPKEQYWERVLLPKDFEKKVFVEKKKDEEIKKAEAEAAEMAGRLPDKVGYSDPELDIFRAQEWKRRIYGVWFWNNGVLVYLTGLHYFYLNYWYLDEGYPDFRIIDWEKAVFWQTVVEDPKAIAMIEVRKRRDGKSFFAGCMLFECMSRTYGTVEGGVISYHKDAADEFFSKTVVSPFKKLASFFIPVWDTSSTLKSDISFTQPSVKGKANNIHNNGEELGSYLTFMDAKPKAYDGHKTKRLVVDEIFKTEVDCFKRHQVVKYCAKSHTGKVTGKILYTSTVEEIGVKFRGDKFFAENDQLRRLPVSDSIKRSGEIYCFFMPAYRSGEYNKYGYCDEDREKQIIKDSQAQYEHSESDLIADMRKNPFTIIQAFRITSNTCHFNQAKLHDRIDEIGWADLIQRGDMNWENGIPLTKSLFIPNKQGKFWIPKAFKFDSDLDCNNVIKRGNSFMPGNTSKFVLGLDGYDHNVTQDTRKSDAALYALKKHNPMKASDLFNMAFVLEYVTRPATASIMYDDVLKACFYFGAPLLFENNKPGIQKFFESLGCSSFLIHLDEYKEPGIPSTRENKQTGVDIIEEHIYNHLDKIYYKRLIQSWIRFDINNTQKEDETMGSMWTLLGDRFKTYRRDVSSTLRPITDYVRKYKIAV